MGYNKRVHGEEKRYRNVPYKIIMGEKVSDMKRMIQGEGIMWKFKDYLRTESHLKMNE